MTEFDFDELDKAVNKLMDGVDTSKRNTRLDDPQDKVVSLGASADDQSADDSGSAGDDASKPSSVSAEKIELSTTSSEGEATEPQQSDEAPAVSPKPTIPPLATRRRGQFMDVIHPSNVKKPATVRRQGATIQPISDVAPAPIPTEAPSTEGAEAPDTSTSQEPSFDFDKEPQSAVSMVVEEDTPPVASTLDLASPDTTEDATPGVDESESLTSPFLPDAKPEKRPLGGALQPNLEQPPEELTPEETMPGGEHPADQLPENPTPVVLPEELKGDVVAIEATSPVVTDHETAPAEAVVESTQPEAEVAATAPVPEQPATGPASIPQQYTEAPSSGDQTNGSIYDTSTYHQALLPAPKKRFPRALKVTLWILGLMIVGAGLGALYFIYTRG